MRVKLAFVPAVVLALIAMTACDKENVSRGKFPVPEAVDLGIEVDGKTILWASWNVGATHAKDNGYYYAWGEVVRRVSYTWTTYRYASDAKGDKLKKYLGNGDATLLPEDDVARKKFGGSWRIPTEKEWDALWLTKNDPDYEWHRENMGLRIVSNKAGTAGNSIFLPLAGYYQDGSTNYELNKHGGYWSSTLDPSDAKLARFFQFSFNEDLVCVTNGCHRCWGLSVRAVCEK